MDYRYKVSGNAPVLYPTETWFGILYYSKDESLPIPKRHPFHGDWGGILSTEILSREDYPMSWKLDMVWLSLTERQFYSIEANLPVEQLQNLWEQFPVETFTHLVVGMAPYGGVALWLAGDTKTIAVGWMYAENYRVAFQKFMPDSPMTLDDYCRFYLNNDVRVKEYLARNGLPPRDLFDNYMKQFTYRYQVVFGFWDEEKEKWLSDGKVTEAEEAGTVMPKLDYIEEALYDGTHDKLHDGGLMNYHEAGKPKKLAIKWHIKKSEYSAYFWFEDEEIRAVYDRFYGAHPDTKTDFMIRIDSEKNKYELALYRNGLKEPQVISEPVYQLIVFKNKFECFRSENYNKERGAWIW